MSFFVWRLINNFLPLEENLQQKGINLVSRCVCCQASTESGIHVFLDGPVAGAVWEHFFNVFGLKRLQFSSVSALLLHWFLSIAKLNRNHIRVALPIIVLWFIWKGRNAARFQGVNHSAVQVVWEVEGFLQQLGRARVFRSDSFLGDTDVLWAALAPSGAISHQYVAVSWSIPPPGTLKFNTDASVVRGVAAGGWRLVRNHQGEVIFAFYKVFGDADVSTVEALSLLFGLTLCVQRRMDGLAVEVDSAVLVRLIHSNSLAKWPLCNTLRQIMKIVAQAAIRLSHVFREANGAADKLAGLNLGSQRGFNSPQELPAAVKAIVALDSISFPNFRTQVVRE